MPVQQLSSCGGSAEESSDNTTANIPSDGNTISINQEAINKVYRQPNAVILRNKPADRSNNTASGEDPRTLQRQNTRTIRIHRQRRLSLAGKGTGNYFKIINLCLLDDIGLSYIN